MMKSFLLISFVLCGVFLKQALGKNYYIRQTSVNWFAAFQNCQAEGLQLASVRSEQEESDLENILSHESNSGWTYWIGGADLAEEGTFIWFPIDEGFDYTSWISGTGMPNNANGNENCVAQSTLKGWNDLNCVSEYYYICEDIN